MDQLRKKFINDGLLIRLTQEESSKRVQTAESNSTWLAEHRPEPWSHPAAKDIPEGEAQCYHLYSNPDDIDNPLHHWKTQDVDFIGMFWGYNPTFDILDRYIPREINMYLPIYQRYLSNDRPCEIKCNGEIFDYLKPFYWVEN